jgi:hypothetical protein
MTIKIDTRSTNEFANQQFHLIIKREVEWLVRFHHGRQAVRFECLLME